MRLLLIILSFVTLQVNATKRYVSNAGSNANNGLTSLTSWQTLSYAMSAIASGDSVYLNRGDVFNEKSNPPSSNIYIGAYGTGAMPIITGFKTATGWSNVGNVWSTTLSDAANNLNVVKVNGTIAAKARYPNYGYLSATSVLSNTSLKIPHDATSRTGSEIVILSQAWVLDVATITSHATGASFDTLNFTNVRGSADPGLFYFYQNNQPDTLNEWSFNNTTKFFSVYATSQPVIEYSTIDTLVTLYRKNNITFDGVQFTGANTYAVFIDSSRNDTLKNVSFNNNNAALYMLRHRWTGIINDSLKNSLSYSYFSYQDTSLSFLNNVVDSTGMLAGMGGSGYSTYGGGYNQGDYATFRYNKFTNAGYHGMRWGGQNDTIEYNYINGFGSIKGDCGGGYTYAGNGNSAVNYRSAFRYNIITNGYGNSYTGNYSVGIYLDDYVDSVLVDGNTISNMLFADIQTKGFHHKLLNNTLYDSIAINIYSATDYLTVKGNILYNKGLSNSNMILSNVYSNYTIDSNYYKGAYAVAYNGNKSFASWRSAYPTYDSHSTATLPSGINSTVPVFYSNASAQSNLIYISGVYSNIKGQVFYSNLLLSPFSSDILFLISRLAHSKFRNLKL